MTKATLATALASLLVAPLLAVLALAGPAHAQASAAGDGARATAPYTVKPFRLRPSDDARLRRAWKTWVARKDHRRYTTVVDRSCFCGPEAPLVTQVRGRTVTSVTRPGAQPDGVPSPELRERGYTLPDLYRTLREAYAKADRVQVRYRRGVPVRIFVDRDPMIADEEYLLTVKVRL